MNMMDAGQLKATENLKNAMEEGISARDKAYGDARRKKGNAAEEEQAKGILEMSKDRLLGLLEVLEIGISFPTRDTQCIETKLTQRVQLPVYHLALPVRNPL